MKVNEIMANLEAKHPGENEYLQAVREVLETIEEEYNKHPEFEANKIVERIVEPDRIFTFRVTWVNDKGEVCTNLGYRVQFKSDAEIMRFCQAFMYELWRNIGPDQDSPAGDVGVGGREIGYLYGAYKKLAREHSTGALTGKSYGWGGSLIRPEATGFGAIYYVDRMVREKGDTLAGKRIALSGFGNVAWGAATKAVELGAKVVAISGPDGVCEIENGIPQQGSGYGRQVPRPVQVHRRQEELGCEVRHRHALRLPERARRGRCQDAPRQWREVCC